MSLLNGMRFYIIEIVHRYIGFARQMHILLFEALNTSLGAAIKSKKCKVGII